MICCRACCFSHVCLLMAGNIDDECIFSVDCNYYDLTTHGSSFNSTIMHLNVRSLYHKVQEIEVILNMLNFPPILTLSETWLKSDSLLTDIVNYSLVTSHRNVRKGGGVAIYLNDNVSYRMIDRSCNRNLNLTHNIDYILIELLQYDIALCCMYCPPKTDLTDIVSIISDLKTKVNCKFNFIATGDFNINLLDITSSLSNEFLNNLYELGLHPAVNLPTRVTSTTATLLDNFMCDLAFLPFKSGVIRTDISDHYLIVLFLKLNNSTFTTKHRNFAIKNKITFSRKLVAADWNNLYSINDVDKAFGYFIKKLKRIYNYCFPFIITTSSNKKPPWLTAGLLTSIYNKNKLYVHAKKNSQLKQAYITYKNKLCKLIRIAKQNYHKSVLINFKNNSAKLWSHLNSLIKSKNQTVIPLEPNPLNDFFTSVFKQAPNLKCNSTHTIPKTSFVYDSFFLSPVTIPEIIDTISSISNSHSVGSDGLNPIIIKQNINFIVKQLEYIVNLSFSQAVFPTLLKTAIVTPLFKSGSNLDAGNYRPISILTIFSKLFEKLYYNRLIKFVNNHNILHPHQFGFRSNYSTRDAIAHVISSLMSKINSNQHTALALLDLKKAFDLINHKLLLDKMHHYGIRELPLAWMSSYLNNRSQKTKVNNILSGQKPISAGVPQGSILGPLLFILFVNDVFQFHSVNVEIFLYADDTAIIFSSNSDINLQCVIDKFCIDYCDWCDSNCIVLNPNKSYYLLFNNTNVCISIKDQQLIKTDVAKYLGIYIDNKLLWHYHVEHVLKICCQRIGMFKKVLPYLPLHVILLYYNAFIRSCFSYCTVFWFNNDRSGRYKLVNKINNLIIYLCRNYNLNVKLYGVADVYKLQCLSVMHDIINSKLYLPYFPLQTNNIIHSHCTRATTNLHINSLTSLDHRNFIYHSVLFWNKCSNGIRFLTKSAFLRVCKLTI